MAHDHAPTSPESASAKYRPRLLAAFGITVAFLAVEVVAGFATGSLALLSDAGHMATDALGLGMALAAITAVRRQRADAQRTYGTYRLEILAALANAVLLLGVAAYVLVEAAQRLVDPPEVAAAPLLVVAVLGLVANVVCFALLRSGAGESLNVRGAFLEVLADLLGSVGVIVAALVVLVTGWPYADPLIAAAIGLFVVPRAWSLGRQALRVLLEAAPQGIRVEDVSSDLAAIDGVTEVHDLHVWTLTSSMDAATAHLVVGADVDPHAVLDTARDLLTERHGVGHATLQVEPETHVGCAEVRW